MVKKKIRIPAEEVKVALILSLRCSMDELAEISIIARRKQKIANVWTAISFVLSILATLFFIRSTVIGDLHPVALIIGFLAAILLPLPIVSFSNYLRKQRRIIVIAYLFKKERENNAPR